MSQEVPKDRRKTRIVWLAVALSIGMFALEYWISHGVPAWRDTDWKRRTLDGVSVESPIAFEPGPDLMSRMAPEDREGLERATVSVAQDRAQTLLIMAIRMVGGEGEDMDFDAVLDVAVAAGVKKAAGRFGDTDPKYDSTPLTVSGHPARRVRYRFVDRSGRAVVAEFVFVALNDVFVYVTVIRDEEKFRDDADRVLRSVRVAEAPASRTDSI